MTISISCSLIIPQSLNLRKLIIESVKSDWMEKNRNSTSFLQRKKKKHLIDYASVHSCEVNWFYFFLVFLEFTPEGRHRTNVKVLRELSPRTFQVTLPIFLNNHSACVWKVGFHVHFDSMPAPMETDKTVYSELAVILQVSRQIVWCDYQVSKQSSKYSSYIQQNVLTICVTSLPLRAGGIAVISQIRLSPFSSGTYILVE